MAEDAKKPTGKIVRLPFLLLALLSLIGAGQYFWLHQYRQHIEDSTRELAQEIGPEIASGKPLREQAYRDFIARKPEVGYLVAAHFRSGYRSGVINTSSLHSGAHEVEDYLRTHGDPATLERLVQPGQGFSGEYLDVISVAFVPPEGFSDRTPVGMLKVAVVIPGYPLGRGYLKLWWALFGLSALFAIYRSTKAVTQAPRRHLRLVDRSTETLPIPTTSTPEVAKKEDLAWLEEQEEESERTDRVEVDDHGKEWRVLFNGEDLEGWIGKGNCYLSEGEIVLQPWATSLVSAKISPADRYRFQVFAKKVAGEDGFVLLFRCNDRPLAWILGGWKNTRHEVAGYESTRIEGRLEKNRWYQVEVRINEVQAEGFLDGAKVWSLSRNDIQSSSPDVGFQDGIGVAVWNTLGKFREPKYLQGSSSTS